MMRPEAVILDIGNVLIEWRPERFYDRVIGPERRRALFASVDLDGMNAAIDLGAPFRDTVLDMARHHPDFAAEIRLWHDRWIEMASPEIQHSVALLRRLRARGVPVFALSNFGTDSFALAEGHYPFFKEFDRRYISGHLGLMKPDPRIYELVETETGLPPGRLLFTDDRRDNIEAAAARGWQVHHFDGPEGWARALVAHGLLGQEETAP